MTVSGYAATGQQKKGDQLEQFEIAFCVCRLNFGGFVFGVVVARCRKKIRFVCAFDPGMKVLAVLY